MAKSKKKHHGKTTTKHHRQPKSKGGKNNGENISLVSRTKHRAYHTLFKNWSPYTVAKILNDIWIDKDYELVVKPRGIQ